MPKNQGFSDALGLFFMQAPEASFARQSNCPLYLINLNRPAENRMGKGFGSWMVLIHHMDIGVAGNLIGQKFHHLGRSS